MGKDALAIGMIFGKIKASLGWQRMFKDYLDNYDEPFPSKTGAIEFIILKYRNDKLKLIAFLQLLFVEHRYTTVDNLLLINQHLRPFGLAVNQDCVIYLVGKSNSFLTENKVLLAELFKKTSNIFLTKPNLKELIKNFSHHLKLVHEHFNNERWDDVSSQSRKALECIILIVAWTKTDSIPESVHAQLKLLVSLEVLSDSEKDLIYALYRILSTRGAHPGIGKMDEAVLRYRTAFEIIRYLIKLV